MTEIRADDRSSVEPARAVSLVDCDIHPMIPYPELNARLPTRWRRHLERYGRRTPIVTEFYPRAANAGFRADSWPSDGLPGSDLGLLRQQLLDEYGVDYGILNSLGMTGVHEVPELAAELTRVLNDWMWEWMTEEPRLLGAIVVPHEYPELAVREIERCAVDERWVQVLLPDSAEEPLGSLKYRPIFEAAAARGLPVAMHTAGSAPHGGTGWPSYYLEEHVGNAFQMQVQLTNMICEGLLDAMPDLRLVLSGVRRRLVDLARVGDRQRLGAAPRRGPGSSSGGRLRRSTSRSGSRRSRSRSRTTPPTSSARSSTAISPTACSSHRLPALGLRLADAGASRVGLAGPARAGSWPRTPPPSTACRFDEPPGVVIDADVHCAPDSMAALEPYLDAYWREYVGAPASASWA